MSTPMSSLTSHVRTYEVAHTVITVITAMDEAEAEALARRGLEASGVDPFSIVEGAESVEAGA